MVEISCPHCNKTIELIGTERERRIEAQRKSAKVLTEQSKEAGELVTAGRTVEQIAEHLGVSVDRARKLSQPGGFFSNRVTDYAEIRALWDDNWRADDIAEKLGCHITTVYRALKG